MLARVRVLIFLFYFLFLRVRVLIPYFLVRITSGLRDYIVQYHRVTAHAKEPEDKTKEEDERF